MSARPRYREIADDLRRRITEGEFPVGSPLPSISALQDTYGVPAMNTIRQAQELLRDEGLIETVQGKGSFVIAHSSPGRDEAGYAEPPLIDNDLAVSLTKARERLLKEARGFYQDGYRRGAQLAAELSWTQLKFFVGKGGIVAGAKYLAEQKARIDLGLEEPPPGSRQVMDPDLLVPFVGAHADYTGSEVTTPYEETIEGMDRALHDLWDQVRPPTREGTTPPPNEPTRREPTP